MNDTATFDLATARRRDSGPRRDSRQGLRRGLRCRCPHCGKGRMFRAYLKVVDYCAACGEPLHHQRADDAPAYFVVLIVGHIVVPLALSVEIAFAPPYWVHFVLWAPLTIGLALALLQPVKGAIVAWQWSHGMHGFAAEESAPEAQPPNVVRGRSPGVEHSR